MYKRQSPDSPARAGLLDAQGNIDPAALNEEISLRLAQELVADPEKLVRAVERDRGLTETFLDFVRGLKNRIAKMCIRDRFTELANAAADTLIMGDLSDYNLAVRQYRAQGESEEEARRHAGWDVAKQAGLAFAGGGLMGFGSAAGGMAYNGAANRYAAPRAVESLSLIHI